LHAQDLNRPEDSIGRWGRGATIRDEIGHTAIFGGVSPPDTADDVVYPDKVDHVRQALQPEGRRGRGIEVGIDPAFERELSRVTVGDLFLAVEIVR
jgi:hypothetical protein